MYPIFYFGHIHVNSFSFLTYVYIIVCFFVLFFSFPKKFFLNHVIFVAILGSLAMYGGNLFHLLFDEKTSLSDKVASSSTGFVFYGSFLLPLLIYPLLIFLLYRKENQKKLWDLASKKKVETNTYHL